ncbi:hypothetical protein [Streptomyces sp. NPDC017529]|uniref:hypothetical protein n=1 Tax=Streptomyces sp. NPDC017529 TaxID=3365000 RepID=UPI0037962580
MNDFRTSASHRPHATASPTAPSGSAGRGARSRVRGAATAGLLVAGRLPRHERTREDKR